MILRRIHRIVCLSILAALAVWAQNANSKPKIQSMTCQPLTVGLPATCTVMLTKAAPKGGLVIVTNAAPSQVDLTYTVTATVKKYPSTVPVATMATITKSVLVLATSPVTVPEGKTSTSFQVRAQ